VKLSSPIDDQGNHESECSRDELKNDVD